jgi:hypothetical protein
VWFEWVVCKGHQILGQPSNLNNRISTILNVNVARRWWVVTLYTFSDLWEEYCRFVTTVVTAARAGGV